MPHASSGGGGGATSGGGGGGGGSASSGDDFASTDEVKVYKDEGDDEKRSSDENLSEDKIGLVTETEEVGCLLRVASHRVACVARSSVLVRFTNFAILLNRLFPDYQRRVRWRSMERFDVALIFSSAAALSAGSVGRYLARPR